MEKTKIFMTNGTKPLVIRPLNNQGRCNAKEKGRSLSSGSQRSRRADGPHAEQLLIQMLMGVWQPADAACWQNLKKRQENHFQQL